MARILIVDDERDVVEFLTAALEVEDWRVGSAYNGVEAVLKVIDGGWDVVLMDIRMPELNGINALRIMRQLAPDLPVVMFTGQAGQGDMFETTRLGAFTCLMKPVGLDKLIETLKAALANSKNNVDLISRPFKINSV